MNRMKKILFTLMITSSLLVSSCSDWLDILPKNEQVTADYWKAKEDVTAVLASGYYYMRTTTPFLIDWGELRGASIYAYNSTEKGKLQDFQMTASSSLCAWETFYKVMNMANSVIKYAPQVQQIDETYTEEAMRSHQTEAYFMRGLTYFNLVRNFKEVPLVLEPYIDDSAPYSIAKSTEEEIIAQIKADIQTALNSEAAKEFFDSDEWSGASKGRATKWALYALMTDVCLWSEDYDGCITYANKLINPSSGGMHPAFMTEGENWFSMFDPGNSNESIFELNWDYATYGQTSYSPSQYFKVSSTATYQYTPAMLERLVDEYTRVVLSLTTSVRGVFGSYVTNGEVGCVWKFAGTQYREERSSNNQDANYIIYRMADVMLMKAEALIRKGKNSWQEAVDLIDQIRIRAHVAELDVNIDDVDELEMLKHVLHERDMELAGEGKRWYDLVRFGKSQSYKYKSEFIEMIVENNSSANDSWIRSVLRNDYAWYLPILNDEIETNPLLVQNPYYTATSK